MDNRTTPAERVKARILAIEEKAKKHNISLSDLRARAGIVQSTWSRWKSDQLRPRAEDLIALEDALETLCAATEPAQSGKGRAA